MASLFSSPPKPSVTKPATMNDKSIQEAQAAKRRAMRGGGRSGTVLTSPSGTASPGPVAAKTLFGQ